ncbi:MAG: DUF4136 domain-containing protein [Chitinophagaceae bacterium]|nr:MAG: DUF4136 domain-containing protein [Chitinophagaceae bacterium]
MKKSTLIYAGLVAFFSITLMSCASTAHIEKDDSIDFGKYKTFSWIAPPASDSIRTSSIAENKIKSIVNEELQKNAGWKMVNNNPDLLLSYDVLVERSTVEQSNPVYSRPYTRTFYNPRAGRYFNVYYPSRFIGYDNYGVQVQEGTVTISMIDTKTDKTVWQGWTTEQIDSRKIKTSEVESAVKTIFKKFDLAKN